MTDTPSGNRWEPQEDGRARPQVPSAASTSAPVEPVAHAAAEYGWVPAPTPPAPARPRGHHRRTGLLAGGALAVLLGAGAGGYAIGSATAGSDSPEVGTTRQGPAGVDPGHGSLGRDDDRGRLGGPDSPDGPDGPEGSDGGAG